MTKKLLLLLLFLLSLLLLYYIIFLLYFPTTMYSCKKQKVLNKISPLIEGFIQCLYGK